MYKIGDEVQIKGKVVAIEIERYGLPYWVGVSNGMGYWLSEADITDKTYEKGLADAWELAKKIDLFDNEERAKIFGYLTSEYIKEHYTVQEVLAKIEAYEKEKEIKVGDVVELPSGYEIVVTTKNDSMVWGVDKKGDTFSGISKENVTKTGKHIDIESLLRQIGE